DGRLRLRITGRVARRRPRRLVRPQLLRDQRRDGGGALAVPGGPPGLRRRVGNRRRRLLLHPHSGPVGRPWRSERSRGQDVARRRVLPGDRRLPSSLPHRGRAHLRARAPLNRRRLRRWGRRLALALLAVFLLVSVAALVFDLATNGEMHPASALYGGPF